MVSSDLCSAFKVFEMSRDQRPMTLFHGFQGLRVIAQDVWLRAQEMCVRDSGAPYLSGWHVFIDADAVAKWAKRVSRMANRWVCAVMVSDLRKKRERDDGIWLARNLFVPTHAWDMARPLEVFLDEMSVTSK